MLRRRLVALLVMLALLHLTASVGEAACTSHVADPVAAGHDAAGAHTEHAMANGTHQGHGAAAAAPEAAAPAPCDMTGAPRCCDAAVPCTEHGLTSPTRAVAGIPDPAPRIVMAGTDAPPSFAPPPEPPPPKG